MMTSEKWAEISKIDKIIPDTRGFLPEKPRNEEKSIVRPAPQIFRAIVDRKTMEKCNAQDNGKM